MTFATPNLVPAYPEIFLLVALSALLIADLFISESKRFLTYAYAQLALVGTAGFLLIGSLGQVVTTFNGSFVDDPMARTLKMISVLTVSFVLAYSRDYIQSRGLFKGEFFVLILFALLGIMVMISANHFLVLYLGLELLSLSLASLIALQRDSSVATEAAMKYFVLAALASGMLLYGLSMIYGATGTLQMAEVANVIAQGNADPGILVLGLVFMVAGLSFKLGVVPFHMWVPDVYEGAPTAVTLFVSTAPKIAGFAFFMRLLAGAMGPMIADWQSMLIIVSVLSMLVGNVTAIAQTNLKRMLAYSTIAHMGFLLLGILSGTLGGYAAAMFYVVTYVLTSLAAFGLILLMSREGFEADQLNDLKGLNKRSPWYAFLMLLIMISMAGIPVSAGFFAKLSVLSAALDAGLTWLVVVAVLMSLIGAFYYLRVVKLMYMDEPEDDTPIVGESDHRLLLSINALTLLALGIIPQPLIDLCTASIAQSLRG
ncbi:NADH-quinone oxidoreductase subunit NuoN [Ferrovum myxofaciens]|jgi:NADH-quinone oxidoreductase subunit N|uniref:NADH-quinone oxidoreductase subunit N n=2 Tax=root TaxID=1 RepID=A0A8F3DY27_9PROT|nr:NADH-quinone oxidoreductase subunit NuoN [Ferrovum myxofaciens]MBW8028470.1 NADH-quinone oxidoreductase subunit NuoN [Ferrovum sp.]KXW59338.1 NADH-quinone oxidoreductase subunit N [Ferrovum myxofaciens]MBU6995163.1 NADH-quinone oxidoreductase subunit NuoN [Ferrovum myxofaciens]QKE38945.1 MAG: NADH-quinone oxidoreductase subunit NuoN [Ferrovum myxofaciens]QKE41538.1 MAG: NADH-quinone oxidoreductase subunit NuoN [Ferrovum myxofaciens]